MPRRRRSSTISALLRSANSRGGTPCLSASYVMGVPCSSVPLAMSTRDPRRRSKRARTSAGTAKPATWPIWRGPLAYGHAGATRTVLLLSTGDHKRNLAARWVGQSGQHLGRGAAQQLLVKLGQLARKREVALGHDLSDDRERFPDAVWRVESDRGPRIAVQRGEQPADVARFARKEAEERETRAAIAGGRERSGDRAGSRNRNHGVTRGPGCGDQRLAWVRQGRRPGVADESDVMPVELRQHARQAAALDRGAIADEGLAYAVPGEKPGCDSRVLRGDRSHLTEDSKRTRTHVLEIADRCGDHVQPTQSRSNHSPTLSAISAAGPTKREAGGRTSRKAFP